MKIDTYIGRKRRLNKQHRGCDWIVEYKEKGKRHRKFFVEAAEADIFIAQRRAHFEERGRIGVQMTEEQIDEYFRAKAIVGTTDLETVLRLQQDKGLVPQLPLDKAIEDFRNSKAAAGRSLFHKNSLKYNLRSFKKKFGDWQSIKPDALLSWLLARGAPKTIHNYYGNISNFCNYAVRRKWIDKSPLAEIHQDDLPRVLRGKKGALTPAQAKLFFEAVSVWKPQYLPFFAVMAFAGIRRAEAGRIQWGMIDRAQKAIIIPAEICKTADSWRMDALPKNIWGYLKRPEDGIWRVPTDDDIEGLHARQPFPWPKNALRHSFCTYHLSLYRDPARTALLLRHKDQRQLYASYLAALVDKKTAADYFAVVV